MEDATSSTRTGMPVRDERNDGGVIVQLAPIMPRRSPVPILVLYSVGSRQAEEWQEGEREVVAVLLRSR
jgi:hypothetical protein